MIYSNIQQIASKEWKHRDRVNKRLWERFRVFTFSKRTLSYDVYIDMEELIIEAMEYQKAKINNI